jgi:hypothetical protein
MEHMGKTGVDGNFCTKRDEMAKAYDSYRIDTFFPCLVLEKMRN